MEWSLYILDCGGRFYTGIAKDPQQRFLQHTGGGTRGARFTRAFPARSLVYSVALGSRGLALRAEARLKKLSRARKQEIVAAALTREQLLDCLGLSVTNEAPSG